LVDFHHKTMKGFRKGVARPDDCSSPLERREAEVAGSGAAGLARQRTLVDFLTARRRELRRPLVSGQARLRQDGVALKPMAAPADGLPCVLAAGSNGRAAVSTGCDRDAARRFGRV
jgi:hypothetical protein